MKKMSKYFSLAIAAIMTLCLCSFGMVLNVGADDTYTITLNRPNNDYSFKNHTFKAYKVFDVVADSDANAFTYTITNDCLGWGDNTHANTSTHSYLIESATYNQSTINSEQMARQFAEALKKTYFSSGTLSGGNASSLKATKACDADYADTTAVLDFGANSGYYLIIDEYADTASVTSLVMLDTAGNQNSGHTGYDSANTKNITINVKSDAPANVDDKQVRVKAESGATAEAFAGYADSETGKTVEFLITAKIPNIDVKNYKKYEYQIIDTIDKCFTVDTNSLKVYTTLNSNALSGEVTVPGAAITAKTPSEVSGKDQYLINLGDIHDKVTFGSSVGSGDLFYTGETIYIYYTATFNGTVGNAAIKYYPHDTTTDGTNEAKIKYNNNPYDDSKYYTSTVYTNSYVWTFGFDFTKVKRADSAATLEGLVGAQFQVQRLGASEDLSTSGSVLRFKKIANGEYAVVKDDETLTTPPTGAVGEIVQTLDVDSDNSNKGKLIVYGFDKEVNYKLVETKAPDGYGLAAPTLFKVNSVTYNSDGSAIASATYKINGDNVVGAGTGADRFGANKTVTDNNAQIWNQSGSELVGTGGMGTTIFYVAGGILMVGAAILLITKLRMRNKD